MTDNQQHPITPPPELIEQWMQVHNTKYDLARQAAQWGSDQELEACCHCFARDLRESLALELRARRRPKPPSLKEQALAILTGAAVYELRGGATTDNRLSAEDMNTIRRALEQLDD